MLAWLRVSLNDQACAQPLQVPDFNSQHQINMKESKVLDLFAKEAININDLNKNILQMRIIL